MGGRGGGASATRPAQGPRAAIQAPASPTAQVRQAYVDLKQREGDWVSLADLRERLTGLSRAEQDTALKQLAVTPGVQVIPWDNRNALGPRDHAAALRFGGEDNHAIRVD